MAIQALDRRYISFARLEAKLKALFPDCTTLKIAVCFSFSLVLFFVEDLPFHSSPLLSTCAFKMEGHSKADRLDISAGNR